MNDRMSGTGAERYRAVRDLTTRLCEPLEVEDMVVQSMPDVSPTKWHLAHTTWFFETFLLQDRAGYRPFEPAYVTLFNSYYNSVGAQFPRDRRGLVTRPTVAEVRRYRAHVDEHLLALLDRQALTARELEILEIGLHHEQQHQELMITDLKHVLFQSPSHPDYGAPVAPAGELTAMQFVPFAEGLFEVGRAEEEGGFSFDNERPAHQRFIWPFALSERLVNVSEYAEFMADGGYAQHELWSSQGWAWVQQEQISAPLYWTSRAGEPPRAFTLSGERELSPAEPVAHVSQFEAEAYARWAKGRLPREHELEVAARHGEVATTTPNLVESGYLNPVAPRETRRGALSQLQGDGWEWTSSSYDAYPGYRPAPGALGEYNGKFMSNQYVLRGGSCATSASHLRPTYRNFFPSSARWQFTAIRLAQDLH